MRRCSTSSLNGQPTSKSDLRQQIPMFNNSRSFRRERKATKRRVTALLNMVAFPFCVWSLLLASTTLVVESKSPALLRTLQERVASNHRPLWDQLRPRQKLSRRLLQASPAKDREPKLLRGYQPTQNDAGRLASLRRKLNMRTLNQTDT